MVSGQSLSEAASDMGWNVNALRRAASKASFRAKARETVRKVCLDWDLEFEDKGSELQRLINDSASEAVNQIARIMLHGTNDRVRLSASTEMLDRSTLGLESKKATVPAVHFHITAEQAALAIQTAQQIQTQPQLVAGGELSEKD
jgi:hypothetical protein